MHNVTLKISAAAKVTCGQVSGLAFLPAGQQRSLRFSVSTSVGNAVSPHGDLIPRAHPCGLE
jgi:hypothetical protein